MHDVRVDDLKNPHRLLLLFADAEQRGMVRACEADKLVFFAAAERAKRVATRNISGCFVQLIRQKQYAFVAQGDEDRARRALLSIFQEGQELEVKPRMSP